jgi:hypothetical protein
MGVLSIFVLYVTEHAGRVPGGIFVLKTGITGTRSGAGGANL